MDTQDFYVTEFIEGKSDNEEYYGEAIERLAKFENLFDHLMKRKDAIPIELDSLRSEGKNKTYGYKEKFAEKLMNDMMLNMLEQYGLK
ncbi:MAG: hypothetical protein WBI17_14345 [Clostridiaceae bacterium]